MKKLVLVLAVLFVSLPAMAAVTITADCNSGVYTVSYATDGNLPRAFALDIEVATGTITAVGDLSADYDIYPGSIVIVDGAVSDAGSAVCDASYPDTLGGIGTAGVTIEMGSLYAAGDPAPATSGVLFTFTTSEAETVATITENGIRGGLVMENPEETIVPTITVVDCETIIPPCIGDVDGSGFRNKVDITALVNLLVNNATAPLWKIPNTHPAYTLEADVDGSGFINKVDITALVNFLVNNATPPLWKVMCP